MRNRTYTTYTRNFAVVGTLLMGLLSGGLLGQENEQASTEQGKRQEACLARLQKTTNGEMKQLQAEVIDVSTEAIPSEGICEGSLHLKVNDSGKERLVYLGPQDYLGMNEEDFSVGNMLKIWGRFSPEGGDKEVFVAHTIVKPSGLVVSLRTHKDGKALWLPAEKAMASRENASPPAIRSTQGESAAASPTAQANDVGSPSSAVKKQPDSTSTAANTAATTTATAASTADVKKTTRSKSQGDKQADKINLLVGHNLVDAIDDVRETTGDLVGAIESASTVLVYPAETNVVSRLNGMLSELNAMEKRLDRKAERTNDSWLNWFEDPNYNVSVKEDIQKLANLYADLARILGEAKTSPKVQVVVGHNIVDQVDDARETIGDLINAINDAGPQWGWFDENTLFTDQSAKLDKIEETLDQRAAIATDADWQLFMTDPKFSVVIRDQVSGLAEVLASIAKGIKAPASNSSSSS